MDENDTNKIAKILILNKDKVLLLMSKHLKKFHLPGGHIKSNETFTQGLNREVKEETGLTISWSKIIFCKPNFCLYKGGAYASTVKLSEEHDGYIWAKIEDAHKYPLCNYTKRDIWGLQKSWEKIKERKKRLENGSDTE
jgi:8-oxo-dGTP pyrophosphatase MutT (NUDIX family)